MSEVSTESRSKIRFSTTEELDDVERKIKRRFGGGLFIDKYTEETDGVKILLGNEIPKDVSDCRSRDRVLKFISYKPIYTLHADQTESGFLIDLPERREIIEGFEEQKEAVARKLDRSVAMSMYGELASIDYVQNQLGGVKDILWVVREKHPVPEKEVVAMRGTRKKDQTMKYLQVLSDIGFVRRDEGTLYTGVNLDAHDQLEVGSDEFDEVVLGQIVQDAYSTLKDELNMTLLAHYPKYAGAYYYSALQRESSEIRLDAESITDNLEVVYGDDDVHKYSVEKKLNELVDVEAVHQDSDGMFYGDSDIYGDLESRVAI